MPRSSIIKTSLIFRCFNNSCLSTGDRGQKFFHTITSDTSQVFGYLAQVVRSFGQVAVFINKLCYAMKCLKTG